MKSSADDGLKVELIDRVRTRWWSPIFDVLEFLSFTKIRHEMYKRRGADG